MCQVVRKKKIKVLSGVKVFRGVFCVRTPQEVHSVDIIAAVVRVVRDQGACTWKNPHLPR